MMLHFVFHNRKWIVLIVCVIVSHNRYIHLAWSNYMKYCYLPHVKLCDTLGRIQDFVQGGSRILRASVSAHAKFGFLIN